VSTFFRTRQKSVYLPHTDKIELKKISFPSENKKYSTAQPVATMTEKRSIDNGLQGRTDRRPAYNNQSFIMAEGQAIKLLLN
jgi:hypothetical protein